MVNQDHLLDLHLLSRTILLNRNSEKGIEIRLRKRIFNNSLLANNKNSNNQDLHQVVLVKKVIKCLQIKFLITFCPINIRKVTQNLLINQLMTKRSRSKLKNRKHPNLEKRDRNPD